MDIPSESPSMGKEQLMRFVRTLRQSERGWRLAAGRNEDALSEERARLSRTRESNRRLTESLAEAHQRIRRLELELEQSRARATDLEQRVTQSLQNSADLEARLHDPRRDEALRVIEQELEDLRLERDELRGVARRRDHFDEERASLRRQVSELTLAWEKSQEQIARRAGLEATLKRLEGERGMGRVVELEATVVELEERAALAEARAEHAEGVLDEARERAVSAQERVMTLEEDLAEAQSAFRNAWRTTGEERSARETLREETEIQLAAAEVEVREARSARIQAGLEARAAARALAESRQAEAAFFARVEAEEAAQRGVDQDERGLRVERLAAHRALEQGRLSIAALREKLLAARRVQSLSARLANLVCPPGAEDTRKDRGDYALVLQLHEAQRELRRAWTSVEEAEGELEGVESELGERARGVELLRQERRLRQALEQQRDALLGTLEERTLESEALERELGALQVRLEDVERDAERNREAKAALVREREVSLTARRQRAKVVTELRERDARLKTLEAEHSQIEAERNSLLDTLTEAQARVDALRTEADLRHDQALSAASGTERIRREQAAQITQEQLEAAEAERARLEAAERATLQELEEAEAEKARLEEALGVEPDSA